MHRTVSPHRRDQAYLCATAGLRAGAVGLSGVILALHLTSLGFDAAAIGLAVALGLGGCAVGTAVMTYAADRMGRRASLVLLASLMAAGGVALALAQHPSVVLVSLAVGMVNGMGRDRGAGLTVEQAILPRTTSAAQRTTVFAWYNLVIDLGHAFGSLLAGLPALLRAHTSTSLIGSYQWTWALYSLLCVGAALCACQLSASVERAHETAPLPLSPQTRRVVAKYSALSALDSFGGGFLTTALVGYWFFRRFGVNEALLGPLFFIVRLLNGLSHLGAAWLARRIGLVNTMVWTHLPSSLLLMTVPFAPTLPIAVTLFLIRESLVEMDVPTRQSYLVAVVKDEERTRAAGISNLTRNVAWAIAPGVAGWMMRAVSLSSPLIVGPGLKVLYDVLLYRAFRHLKPPEEQT